MSASVPELVSAKRLPGGRGRRRDLGGALTYHCDERGCILQALFNTELRGRAYLFFFLFFF